MRVGVVTREWPPEVYGGAGVHVVHLVAELRRRPDLQVDVHCLGGPRPPGVPPATAHLPDPRLADGNPALATVSADVAVAAALADVDLVHTHTWYANLAGRLAGLLHAVPHVVTAHSLEPLRPWKAEQLGGGYALSSWVEREALLTADAVVAVSEGMRRDVLAAYPGVDPARVHVIHNGIDPAEFAPDRGTGELAALGVAVDVPTVLFVGRITRQKGLPHLLRAAARLDPDVQLVVAASAPDTPEIAAEVADLVAGLARDRQGVVWLREPVAHPALVQLLSHATVFCCPSVYEPMGIVNLEAMACGTAVVASAVGGIPEVVADGETGLLVPLDPADPEAFEVALADALGAVLADPHRAAAMGRAGRDRAVAHFGWDAVAARTEALYRTLA